MKLNIHIAYCMCNTESQEKVHDFTSTVCIVYSTFILDADIVRKNLMGFVLCLVIRFIRSKAVKNFAVTQKIVHWEAMDHNTCMAGLHVKKIVNCSNPVSYVKSSNNIVCA